MTIHLKNEENRTELNLDFTKFFSTRNKTYVDENGVLKKGERLNHKAMMDNLVNVYISPSLDEFWKNPLMSPVDLVDKWFEEAYKELLVDWKDWDSEDSPLKILNENWKFFRTKYKLDIVDPIIEKMNKFKGDKNTGLYRFKSGDCSFVSDAYFIVVYDKNEGLLENIDPKGRTYQNSPDKALLKVYEDCVENSKYLFKITPKALKSVKKMGVAVIGGFSYNIPSITTWLGKDDVEVWKDDKKNNVLLRQNDRDILLVHMNPAGHEEEDFIELEGLAL